MRRNLCVAAACAGLVIATPDAAAITIIGKYIGDGESFSPTFAGTGGAVPAGTTGDTSDAGIEAIFDTAASYWERAIADEHTITIEYGFDDIDSIAVAFSVPTGPHPPVYSKIMVNNDGSSSFFADPTPTMNEEWLGVTETDSDLGGGVVNVGREYKAPAPASIPDVAGKVDLLLTFMHEIGHAISLNAIGDPFSPITAPRPFDGSVIPMADATHFAIPEALMFTSPTLGERKVVSAIDILGAAEAAGWETVDTAPDITAPFDPAPAYAVTDISAAPVAGDWSIDTGEYLGFAHHGLPTLLLTETATSPAPFDVEITVSMTEPGGSVLFAMDKIVKNLTPEEWTGFELVLGTTDPGGEFTPSTIGDGLRFLLTPSPSEETGHFKDVLFDDVDDINMLLYMLGPGGFPLLTTEDAFFWLGLEVADLIDGIEDGMAVFTLRQIPIGEFGPPPPAGVPEPGSAALLALAALASAARRR